MRDGRRKCLSGSLSVVSDLVYAGVVDEAFPSHASLGLIGVGMGFRWGTQRQRFLSAQNTLTPMYDRGFVRVAVYVQVRVFEPDR